MNTESSRLAWGILGTGRIAATFAKALAQSQKGRLAAVGSRQAESAGRFVAEHGCGAAVTAHASYEALLADPAVEAVYIGTPHPVHAQWAIRAARAGKHVLCEKPVALNHAEAMAMIEAAREHDVFFMEAFMYRAHPQMAKVIEIVRSGVLGEVGIIRASFGFAAAFNAKSRLFAQDLGGGGILDVGCYPMSMARLIAGATMGKPFAEPVKLRALGALNPQTGVDDRAVAVLEFENGVLAELSTAITASLDNTVSIHGSNGWLKIPTPWLPGPVSQLELTIGGKTEILEIDAGSPLYTFEIDAVADHLAARETPFMPMEDTLGNIAALDQWRAAVGLLYPSERETAIRPALPPLRRTGARPVAGLLRTLPGLEKPVARMMMGTANRAPIEPPTVFALYDLYTEYGGNCFDTAHLYGGGACERLFGQWLRQRGLREQTVILGKGAHTPNCNPVALRAELNESLERLQTDYLDLYALHRDNPEIPVGEFVDVLNELRDAGRFRLFGGSNWSIARVQEANAYARKKGLQGFTLLSNQFSLARMVDSVWNGCLSASDAASREWLEREGVALFAWSSQARGFFVRGARDFTGDAELVRCWYTEDNFERLRRAQELGREKKTAPIHIAAAYVLQQRFPTFALIGPNTLAQVSSCFASFEVTLTPEEIAWLNLERDSRSRG